MLGWLNNIVRSWFKASPPPAPQAQPPVAIELGRLERVTLSEGVAHTLFEDYADHRNSARGDEEIGWILMGVRNGNEAHALAAIPAGTQRDAGEAHIRFNSEAQALASRIIRQSDKRLRILGVVHTHPGRLSTPSAGDYQGDRVWVEQLFGGEGVFAIGTAGGLSDLSLDDDDVQARDDLRFSWYALGKRDSRYRKLTVQTANGPDLAARLRPVWDVIETHAHAVNALCKLFASVQLGIVGDDAGPQLLVRIRLAQPGEELQLLLSDTAARYYWSVGDELIAVDPEDSNRPDRAVHLILAALAKEPSHQPETPAFAET